MMKTLQKITAAIIKKIRKCPNVKKYLYKREANEDAGNWNEIVIHPDLPLVDAAGRKDDVARVGLLLGKWWRQWIEKVYANH